MKIKYLALFGVMLLGLSIYGPAKGAVPEASRPVLVEFLENVLQNHPALEAAKAELDAAKAASRAQGQPLYNPKLKLGYEDAQNVTKEIGVSQTIDWAGKRQARANAGQTGVAAAAAAFDVTRKALLARLLQSLAGHQAKLDVLKLNENRAKIHSDFLKIAERRNAEGDLPQTDLLTARLAFAESLIEKSRAISDLSRARESLVALVGEDRLVWPFLDGAPPLLAPSIEEVSFQNLPELRLVRAQSQSVISKIQVAEKNRIPDPTFGVRGGEEGATKLFGVELSIPLPVFNSFSDEVDEARANAVAAGKGYAEVLRNSRARLIESRGRYSGAVYSWQAWQQGGVGSLDAQRALLQKLWETGEIAAVDYLVQLNQTFSTEIAAAELRGRLWSSWFQWLDASGEFNSWMEAIR